VYIDVKRKRDYAVRTVHYVQLVTRFMEKIERILERYKIYLAL
jgi:hypothetical protein